MNKNQVRNSARAFQLAARRCMEPRPSQNGQVEMLAVPAIVCSAFSSELGLKALLLDAGKHIKSHDLQRLFEQLDQTTQKRILSASGVAEAEFLDSLAASADVFEDWRYIHERSARSASPAFLATLAQAIQTVLSA